MVKAQHNEQKMAAPSDIDPRFRGGDGQQVAPAAERVPDLILERLMALHPKIIDLSLDRVWELLAALGNPQDRLPPVVHVAGTNGKGSTIAFLRAFLEAAGYRIHVYTSPHLVRFNERIRLAGDLISDADLFDLLEEVEQVNGGVPITYFEITTCAALLAFARVPTDIVLLETGLGGRLDATNVIRQPAATIITPIGMDHEQYLGDSLSAIATEKAHIIKPGTPCIVSAQRPEALRVIEAHAEKLGVNLALEGRDWSARPGPDGFTYAGKNSLDLPPPGLLGLHQIQNAGAALATVERLTSLTVPETALRTGLRSVDWPARLQRLTRGPLADMLPEGWDLWLDGAHNPQAGNMLVDILKTWDDKPLDIIAGMMGPKDARGFFAPVARFISRLRTVPVPGEINAKKPEETADAANAAGVADVHASPSVAEALAELTQDHDRPPRCVLIVGSLYLAGRVLADNG